MRIIKSPELEGLLAQGGRLAFDQGKLFAQTGVVALSD